MEAMRKRGRPPTYGPAERERLAALIRQHGIAGARRAGQTSANPHTLAKIAREFGIELPKGRQRRAV